MCKSKILGTQINIKTTSYWHHVRQSDVNLTSDRRIWCQYEVVLTPFWLIGNTNQHQNEIILTSCASCVLWIFISFLYAHACICAFNSEHILWVPVSGWTIIMMLPPKNIRPLSYENSPIYISYALYPGILLIICFDPSYLDLIRSRPVLYEVP